MKHTTLQVARDRAGVTNQEIATKLGCSRSAVEKIMEGLRKRGELRLRIKQLLGLDRNPSNKNVQSKEKN